MKRYVPEMLAVFAGSMFGVLLATLIAAWFCL